MKSAELKSDIKMLIRMCWIEHVPIEQSRFQQAARALGMEEAADRLSYEVEVGIEPCTTTFSKSSDHS